MEQYGGMKGDWTKCDDMFEKGLGFPSTFMEQLGEMKCLHLVLEHRQLAFVRRSLSNNDEKPDLAPIL